MDNMYIKYKEEFISSINFVLDMLYNTKDTMDIKLSRKEEIDKERYDENLTTINQLEKVREKYKTNQELTNKENNLLVAALGTTVVYMEFLSKSYKEAAEKAKIIIANIKS